MAACLTLDSTLKEREEKRKSGISEVKNDKRACGRYGVL
jgi:hypothetical protein